jgi:hypothetical protein
MGVEELQKPPCEKCIHEAGKCTIYHFRPNSCREFRCMWLDLVGTEYELPKAMRPDRCGVIFAVSTDNSFVTMNVDPARPDSVNNKGVKKLAERLAHGTPVYCKVGMKMFKARVVTEPEKPLHPDSV